MKGVGEPCAGKPHARFDGRGLETERFGVTAPAPDPTNLTSSEPLFWTPDLRNYMSVRPAVAVAMSIETTTAAMLLTFSCQ